MTWTMPTIAAFLGIPGGTRMPCPVCGAGRTADTIYDFRKAPAGLRPVGRDGKAAQFGCDGCREALERRIPNAMERIYKAVGAPAALVSKLGARRQERAAVMAGRPGVPLDAG